MSPWRMEAIRFLILLGIFIFELDLSFLEDHEEGAKYTSMGEDALTAVQTSSYPSASIERASIPPSEGTAMPI